VGVSSIFSLPQAPSELSTVRSKKQTSALVARQTTLKTRLSAVSGRVGQAVVVARSLQVLSKQWIYVYRSVRRVVEYGLAQRNLDNIKAIGIDEIQYGKGHQYLTLVYQMDEGIKRLLHVAQKRTVRSLLCFFRMLVKSVVIKSSMSAPICGKPI
jgi:hypothetical protein